MTASFSTTRTPRPRAAFARLIPLFVVAHFSHHLLNAIPVPLSPMIRSEFSLDYVQAGLVTSSFSLAYGIGQLPAGWLADRISARLVMAVGIVGVALGGVLVGLSNSYAMLLVFMALMGLAGGGYHPASAKLVAGAVESRTRGRALGLHAIGGSASFFLSPLLAAGIAAVWTWRGSFIALSVPTLIFGVVCYVLLTRWSGGRDSPAEDRSGQAGVGQGTETTRWRRLVPFIVLSSFTAAVMMSTVAFIPLFVVDRLGQTKETGAAMVALIYSSGLWASVLGGYLSDRLGGVRVVVGACLAAGPLLYLLSFAPYGVAIGAVLVTMGMITYIRMPVSEAYVVSQTAPGVRSTVLGLYYFGSMEAGGLLTPALGYLVQHFGFYTAFTAAGAAILTGVLVCGFFLWRARATP